MNSEVMSKESNSAVWRTHLSELGALWIHDGNAARPHALLTSGNHSNGFFNATKVTERPDVLFEACMDLYRYNEEKLPAQLDIDWTVGSAFGAITIAHVVAQILRSRMAFTEPVETPDGKLMQLKRFDVQRGDRVLVVEDVTTTGSTSLKTIAELKKRGAEIFPAVISLVNRSGKRELHGREIVALIDHPMPMWTPEECPLCKQGSEAIRPKGNWDKLNATY